MKGKVINVEATLVKLLNKAYPKLNIMDLYEISQGDFIAEFDRTTTELLCLKFKNELLRSGVWYEVDGHIYTNKPNKYDG